MLYLRLYVHVVRLHIIETSVRWSMGKEYNEANEVIIMNFEPPKTV